MSSSTIDASKNYAINLEKRLIEEFKRKFEDKLGYSPTVLTRASTGGDEDIPLMSLENLANCFDPFLPKLYGQQLPLSTKLRKRELVELRNIFCAIARMMKFTCTSIGQFLGGRDHTTVLHNIATFNNLVETSDAFKDKYLAIVRHIKRTHESSIMGEFDTSWYQPEPAVLP